MIQNTACAFAQRGPAAWRTNSYRPPSLAMCSEYRYQTSSAGTNSSVPAATTSPVEPIAESPTASGTNSATSASGPPIDARANPR